jgi:hypothetical protein
MFLINIVFGADANNGDVDPTSIADLDSGLNPTSNAALDTGVDPASVVDLGTGVDPAFIPHFDTIFEKVIYMASL